MITDAGLTEILNRVLGLATSTTPYCNVGSGTTAPAAGDTALQTELASGRVQAATATVSGPVATITTFFNTAQANGTIAETGLNSASASGVQIDRSLETPTQVKDSSKEMIVEYTLTLARA